MSGDEKLVQVLLPPDLHTRTKQHAEANDRSMASVIRMALRAYCVSPLAPGAKQ